MFKQVFQNVFSAGGCATRSISSDDLVFFRSIVAKQYKSVLKNIGNVTDPQILDTPINRYHEICDLVNHASLWGKKNRILSRQDYEAFLTSGFFQELKNEVGDLFISDEEEIGYPEIYWRLVRPTPHRDVGPLHADAWFWELGHGTTPSGI